MAPPDLPTIPGNPERDALAGEMERALRRHVMDAWFPRCLDLERGGFLCDFDRRWTARGAQPRMLEFQARQTRAAARLALAYPREGRWAEYALHGFRNLRDTMWDRDHGGWFWLVGRDGKPLAGETKHAHSTAYAVQSSALVYQLTGDREALAHAEEGLEWFDRRAHDDDHGGYHGWLRRDGSVIRNAAELPLGAKDVDPLDHEVGLKNENVHGDWMETFFELRGVSSSPLIEVRLREFADLHLAHITTAAGEVHHTFHPDWTPQPCVERFGYGVLSAHRMFDVGMLAGFEALGRRGAAVLAHTVRQAWRDDGGFRYAGPPGVPVFLQGSDLRVPRRSWWVQLEALRALAMASVGGHAPDPSYRDLFVRQWQLIRDGMTDARYRGIYEWAPADLALKSRPWGPRSGWFLRKGHTWKDASHDTDCLLRCIALLRGAGQASARAIPAIS